MLRVCDDHSLKHPSSQEYLKVEENQKHLSVFVPSHPKERNNALAPKVYAFDAVFTEKSLLVLIKYCISSVCFACVCVIIIL